MSLSSETQRVQQGVKDTLKTLIQKLGGTVASERVDGYPALANAISNKLLPDNLLSAETAALYGKGAEATPNEVFAAIKSLIDGNKEKLGEKAEIHLFSYAGTGTYGVDAPSSLTAEKPIQLAQLLSNGTSMFGFGDTLQTFMLASVLTETPQNGPGFTYYNVNFGSGYGYRSADGKTFYWYDTNARNQFNEAGDTYYGFYIC